MNVEQIELKREVHLLAWDNLQASAFPDLTAAKVRADPRIHREVFGERFEIWRAKHGGEEGNKVGIRLSWEDHTDQCSVEIISQPTRGFLVHGGIHGSTTILPRSTKEYQRLAFEKACEHPTRVPLSPPPPQ